MADDAPLPAMDPNTEERPGFLPAPGHPVILGAASRYPIIMLDSRTVRLWAELDDDLRVAPLSNFGLLGDFLHEVWIWAEDAGIADFFEPPSWGSVRVGCHLFGYGRAQWAMANGLMPHQPFQVEIYARHFMHETADGAEGDCEAHYEILQRRETDPLQAAGFWEEWFEALARQVALARDEIPTSRQAMLGRPDLLAIRAEPFWSEPCDDFSPPDGLRVTLLSTLKAVRSNGEPAYGDSPHLATGESTKCRDEQAWSDLASEVRKSLPQFAHVNLEELPRYRYACETPVVI